jgi:segregation and condensation protein A
MLKQRFESEGGVIYRSAPLPLELRRAALAAATKVYEPDRIAVALGDLLTLPPPPDTRHIRTTVSLQRRLSVLRELLRKSGTLDFDEAFGGDDRFTQAVTLFALLEMYRRGEATWTQKETFGRIEVQVQ